MPPIRRPPSSSRGLMSCLYSSCDHGPSSEDTNTQKILYGRIIDFYEEAFNRLPLLDMPDDIKLVDIINQGGLCVGLLDPVSNIILNTVSLLPANFRASSPSFPRPRKSRRVASKAIANLSKSTWYDIAWRSYIGLIDFMLCYFGCLTMEQASRYLRWADADLALAVLLVEYDLYAVERPADPGSGRTQASLNCAVLRAGHPASDRLVQLTTFLFPLKRLEAIKPILLGGDRKLTIDDVSTILSLLLLQDSATGNAHVTLLPQGGFVTRVLKRAVDEEIVADEISDFGDGYETTTVKPVGNYISSLRCPQDMESIQSHLLAKVYAQKHRLKEACGESCEYIESLKMCLLDTIHSFYLKVIARLPYHGANSLIRGILVAGHCYGPVDPVSNIIINSIWYNRLCPLQVADRMEKYDILDTLSILRTEFRSLEGMLKAVHAMAPKYSPKDAVKHLLLELCDANAGAASSSYPFLIAAVAADHPLPAGLGLFHSQLTEDPEKLDNLRSMINTNSVLSVGAINRIADIVDEVFKITPEVQPSLQSQVPELHKDAYSVLLKRRSEYEGYRKSFRSKLAQLLEKYASQHPWEKKYMLGFICGVEKLGFVLAEGYRVNFMAGSESGNTLFFAEFWVACLDEPKPDICCPLYPPYTGRCYYGKASARKLAYPNSAEYIMCDITAYGIDTVDDMLDADFIYFDSKRDVKFAKKMNILYDGNFQVFKVPWRPFDLATDKKIQVD